MLIGKCIACGYSMRYGHQHVTSRECMKNGTQSSVFSSTSDYLSMYMA